MKNSPFSSIKKSRHRLRRSPDWLRYGASALTVSAMVIVRVLLDPWLGNDHAFVTLFPAVAIVTWMAGFGPGVFALFCSLIAGDYFFVPERHTLLLGHVTGNSAFGDLVFLVAGSIVLATVAALNRATDKAEAITAALGKTESKLALILDSISDRLFGTDSAGRCNYINDAAKAAFAGKGIKTDEMIGKHIFEIFPGSSENSWGAAFNRALSQKIPLQHENYYVPWGCWFSTRFYPVDDTGLLILFEDVTERKHIEQRLENHYAVTSALSHADSLESAAPEILREVCVASNLEAAAIWSLDHSANVLRCIATAERSPGRATRFLADSRQRTMPCGIDLPGQVWQERKAVWLPNIAAGRNLPRAPVAAAENLHGAFGAPILVGDEFFGVIEFLNGQLSPPDESLQQMLGGIALQLGQFLARRRADDELRASEERFRNLADNISQLAWMADPDGGISWYNKRWLDFSGCDLEKCKGWGWKRIHHPDHLDRVVQGMQQSWATGESWEDTFPLRGKEGNYRWFLSRAVPIRNNEGKIIRWFGTNTDITDLRNVQDALKGSEERFRLMADACQAFIWLSSPDSLRTWFNKSWLDFVGNSLEAEGGNGWIEQVHIEERESLRRSYMTAVQTQVPWQMEYRLRRADGVYRWVLGRAVPVYEPSGKFSGYVGSCVDNTAERMKQHELEQLVDQRTSELRSSMDEMERLTYGIIHDLRAPLRSMHGWSQSLLEDCAANLNDEGKVYISRIIASSERMDRLVQDVLNYSDALRRDLKLESVDTYQLLLGILESYPEFDRQKADIQIVDTLPSVMANEAALTQCFSNLLRNAITFVDRGIFPRVRIGAEMLLSANRLASGQPSRKVRIWIEDNGIGIPREYWDRIFEMFHRLNSSHEGTGIGLSVAQKAAERMGGQIGLDSIVGQGSRFWIELNAGQPDLKIEDIDGSLTPSLNPNFAATETTAFVPK